MAYLPLSKLMHKANTIYYKNKKTNIYNDFSTYVQSRKNLLGKATAINFLKYFSNFDKDHYNILELGPGNGSFAYSFLDTIYKNDVAMLKKFNYFLADFSRPILLKAFKSLKKFTRYSRIEKIFFDASTPSFKKFKDGFDYIKANEVLSDLDADVYVRIKSKIFLVLFDENLNFLIERKEAKLDSTNKSILYHFPSNYFIPLNFKAKNLLSFLLKKLNKNSYMEFFDYGFYKKEDIILDPEEWNNLIVRKYGNQITTDLNFYYFKKHFKFAEIISQKDYAENILNKQLKINPSNLDYSAKNLTDLKYNIDEQDYFYLIRIFKN